MRVTSLELNECEGFARLSAQLSWEDREAPDRVLWFDFPTDLTAELEPSANAFLPSALGCALRDGERRVLIDGAVCPRHLEGLEIAAELIASWFAHVTAPRIETTQGTLAPDPCGYRSAICLSGGVDSLAALQANRASVPRDHPDFIRDGILYFGLNTFDFDGESPRPERRAAFEERFRRLEAFGDKADVRMIPIATNVRTFASSWDDWDIGGLTPALVAGAHAMPRRIRSLSIAAAGNGIHQRRHGSHPLLDPHFSSLALDVRTVHAQLARTEKVRRLAEWQEALDALLVCLLFEIPHDGPPNCGRCEKCVRTMLELLLFGALERASTFPARDVTADMIRAIDPTGVNPLFYTRSRDELAKLGRNDLVEAIDERLTSGKRPQSLLQRLFGNS